MENLQHKSDISQQCCPVCKHPIENGRCYCPEKRWKLVPLVKLWFETECCKLIYSVSCETVKEELLG